MPATREVKDSCRAKGHVWLNPCRLVVLSLVGPASVAVINILEFWAAVATAIYSRFSQYEEMH